MKEKSTARYPCSEPGERTLQLLDFEKLFNHQDNYLDFSKGKALENLLIYCRSNEFHA